MRYMGSKARFVKDILPIILQKRKNNQIYIEPFAGGMNIISEVEGDRIAIDNNKYLIEMWKWIYKNKEVPLKSTEITRELYDAARDMYNNQEEKTFDDFLIGYIGFMASANGKFFDGGWSGKSVTKIGTVRDYIDEAIRNIKKHLHNFKEGDIRFVYSDYRDFKYPNNSLIYCDIPYKDTTQYGNSKNFNHREFWDWVRFMDSKGHTLFVSEYNAPEDFKCVWSREAKSSLSANAISGKSKTSTEKLFTLNKNQ